MTSIPPQSRSGGPLPSAHPHPGYRPCVGVLLVNSARLVFVGRRRVEGGPEHADRTHAWQMPQGGIDKGEDAYAAALRELYEETNVRSVELLGESAHWYAYDLPARVATDKWKGRWKGQTQKWFALRFTGREDEIDIHAPGGGRHKPEFDAWRWERMDRLTGLIVPFKREVYERVVQDFRRFGA